ncbi:hypothetical protein HYX02_07945 [Candidatus Woesearchaeota archaeon]|nr:hypothetical protein [Candidatus Woesearchaeota archaeon]
MNTSKKGIGGFEWIGLIVIFLIGLGAWLVGFLGPHKEISNYIGQHQFAIMKADNEAEKAMLYIEQSAKIAAQQAAYDFSLRGGYYAPTDCGTFKNANVWAVIDKSTNEIKECYPGREIDKNFLETFGEILGRYLVKYPDADIPAGAYSYKFDSGYIIGNSYEKIRFDIVPQTFVVKPKIKTPAPELVQKPTTIAVTSTPTEIYQKALASDIPKIINEQQGSTTTPNIEVVKKYHPEVWTQYIELCKKMSEIDKENYQPGVCKSPRIKCCISSAYRSLAYDTKIKKGKGALQGPHPFGVALDIYVSRDVNEQIKWARFAVDESQLFTRGAIYPGSDHIHLDLMPRKGVYAVKYWIGSGAVTLASGNDLNQLVSEAKKNEKLKPYFT